MAAPIRVAIAVEFGFGQFVMGHSWSTLLHDYNVFAGRIWILVLLTTLLGPWLLGRPGRGLRTPTGRRAGVAHGWTLGAMAATRRHGGWRSGRGRDNVGFAPGAWPHLRRPPSEAALGSETR